MPPTLNDIGNDFVTLTTELHKGRTRRTCQPKLAAIPWAEFPHRSSSSRQETLSQVLGILPAPTRAIENHMLFYIANTYPVVGSFAQRKLR